MICLECGGSDMDGTCLCSYDSLLYDSLEVLGILRPEEQVKQICHFCGVDLFLPKTDLTIRMCVPCGLALNNKDTIRCIVCEKTYLDDYNCSVCESCKSL